ncbi:putative membrane protein [Bacteroides fragilis str. DS-208]|nr:putative membrane protein [Bacteroides fragilis str. DS-208]
MKMFLFCADLFNVVSVLCAFAVFIVICTLFLFLSVFF